jgi:hypothetical protein
VNRDDLSALARGVITVLDGAALIVPIGRYLGWWTVAAIATAGIVDTVWCAMQLRSWRLW